MTRPPAVAGQFYPGRKPTLESMLADMIPPKAAAPEASIGVMSPHAGYIYSGHVAGATLAEVLVPNEVIILGPNHHGHGHAAALYAQGAWETPLGDVMIARALCSQILKNCPFVASDTVAHRFEHSLEVQVPFLQKLKRAVTIAPICLGHLPLEVLLTLGDGLAETIKASATPVLIVASTDMTHYESGETARVKDFKALDRVFDLDPVGLYEVVRENRISMCGVLPVVVMLRAAVALGASHADLVEYRNSGDVTGDQAEVVGYAGVRIH